MNIARRAAMAVTFAGLAGLVPLAGCDGSATDRVAEPPSTSSAPPSPSTPPSSSTASAPGPTAASGRPILVRTSMHGVSGAVLPGSVVGDADFCAGGTVQHEHGSPQIGFPAINVFDCPDGRLSIAFGPGPDQMDHAVQTSEWKVVEATGAYAGSSGAGRMVVRFPRPGAEDGEETFVGLISS
jgi:hypothetical protein